MTTALSVALDQSAISDKLARYAAQAEGAFSENTLRAVRSDTAVFTAWADRAGLSASLPLDPETVAAFVDAMGTEVLPGRRTKTRAPATVSRYIASLDHMCRAAGFVPVGGSNEVRLALRRLRRSKGTAQDQAPALRRDTLDRALARMGEDLASLRDAALLSVAYDTLARASEVSALRVQDVQSDVDGARAYLSKSKTDQDGEGQWRYLSPETYQRVKLWIDSATLEPSDPLFHGLAASQDAQPDLTPLTPRSIARIFKARIGQKYSSHSARVGAAVDARAAGMGTGEIAQAGGWKSETMVGRYTKHLAPKDSAAAKLARLQGRA